LSKIRVFQRALVFETSPQKNSLFYLFSVLFFSQKEIVPLTGPTHHKSGNSFHIMAKELLQFLPVKLLGVLKILQFADAQAK